MVHAGSQFPWRRIALLLPALALSAALRLPAQVISPAPNRPIAQKKADLLAGFSQGIAYSGFRHGQHPDRGQGAVNPTDAQMLEDLKLIVQARFGLIRLYDSQENTQADGERGP